MKTTSFFILIAAFLPTMHNVHANASFASRYVVTEKGPDHRVWSAITYRTNAAEVITASTNRAYTELASGLNYFHDGIWTEADETIEILSDGSALASHGRTTAHFPSDIYSGDIVLTMEDGVTLRSRPTALAYFDAKRSVVFAILTNSVGVVAGNCVYYTNCFAGLKATLRYTYRRSGFEQDVILEEAPAPPDALGMGESFLGVLTEFFPSSQPTVQTRTAKQAGLTCRDDDISWPTLWMGSGKAFFVGAESTSADTHKSWEILEGRDFLVERLAYRCFSHQLQKMPTHRAPVYVDPLGLALRRPIQPQRRVAAVRTKTQMTRLAKNFVPSGLCIDYTTLSGSLSGPFTFQGDRTYYISANVTLPRTGTTTFEGGTCIKFATNTSINIPSRTPSFVCSASNYHPVVMCAKDDDSVGEIINGSTGNPSGYYANPAISLQSSVTARSFSHFRIANAQQAISTVDATLLTLVDGQFVNCLNGISSINSPVNLQNILFANVGTNFNATIDTTITAVNCTFGGSINYPTTPAVLANTVNALSSFSSYYTNCIFANMTSFQVGSDGIFAGVNNGFYNNADPSFGDSQINSTTQPFQSSGAGNYYLVSGHQFATAGMLNINSVALADVKPKTVFPPSTITGTLSAATIWNKSVARDDSGTTLALGYHYDPLDILCCQISASSGLTIGPGVDVAYYGSVGFYPIGAGVKSFGYPFPLNEVVWYPAVQEQPTKLSNVAAVNSALLGTSAGAPKLAFYFTELSGIGMRQNIYDSLTPASFPNNIFMHCQFRNLNLAMTSGSAASPPPTPTIILQNNLFERCSLSLLSDPANSRPLSLSLYNNLFWSNTVSLTYSSDGYPWAIYDNLFDGSANTVIVANGVTGFNADHNAFYNVNQNFGGPNNITSVNPFTYANGPLGNRYVPNDDGPLWQSGSRNAEQAALYLFASVVNVRDPVGFPVSLSYHYPLFHTTSSGPQYSPAFWNDGGTIQYGNNCYNYACNVLNPDQTVGAKPGLASCSDCSSGTCTSGTCPSDPNYYTPDYITRCAINDGLIPTTLAAQTPAHLAKVALLLSTSPGNYHWIRQDSDGAWSEKFADNTVDRNDFHGNPIPANPATGYWASYQLIGYFLVDPGPTQGHGYSNIH